MIDSVFRMDQMVAGEEKREDFNGGVPPSIRWQKMLEEKITK